MFSMSKKELVARLQVTADLDLSKFGDDMKSRKMLLLTSSGIISCSDISLRSYDDVLKESRETSSVNLLDLALTAPLPERIETEDDKKVFLYCVDVQFLPNSGGNIINIPAICIDLDSASGFSLGNLLESYQ